jgi:predicted kinase
VGKSSVARLLVDGRPLALCLDIDAIRVALGGWRGDPESKRVARDRGFAMARDHLRAGYDVVLPQLVARVDVVEHLEQLAVDAGATLAEVMLVARRNDVVRRFRSRDGGPHPADDVIDVEALLDDTLPRLDAIVAARPRSIVIDASGDPTATARAVEAALA